MKKRLLGILLCLCMVLTLFPALAFAEGGEGETPVCSCETACTAEAMRTECPVCGAEGATPESCGKYTAPAEPTAVEQVQALIDALPAADTITAENRGGVETQLTAIDEAKAALTEEELAALDFTKYEAAIAALNALDGMGGAADPAPADDTDTLQNMLNDGGTVTLDRDYTITKTLTVGNSITLDLKGHVIRKTGSGRVLEVYGGLTLKDSYPEAIHPDDPSLPAGGVITGGNAEEGGGVYVGGGLFTMNGGTIFGCQADRGGGVYVKEGSFTMNDGAIKGCSAQVAGGGVYAKHHFIMNGGAIEDCSAVHNGQAVYITETEFIANAGSIKGTVCVADNGRIVTNAGASYARFYDQVTIESGTISAGIYYGGIAPGPSVISTENYRTLSFDLGGGSGSIPKQYFVGVAGPCALKPADPTKDGYTFTGWFSDEALTTLYDFTAPVTGNLTLYAKFVDGTEALQKLLDEANESTPVKLEKNYTISQTLVASRVTLDLNGHVIRKLGGGSVIEVYSNLTLEDSNPTATHEDSSLPAGGVITGGKDAAQGGGIFAPGVFTMKGGTIYNCKAAWGGGVYAGSQFTMTGGAIENCTATLGGGVYYADQSFTMTGGAIKNCTATFGGGVFAQRGGFMMTGGAIEDCTADNDGQAVYINGATFLADGGTVKGTVYVTDNGHIEHDAGTSFTRFFDQVTIETGTIGYGVYYGGIENYEGNIDAPYHTVDFNLGGGSGSVPTQFFVGIDTATALKPADPTREGYTFTGWFTDEALTTPYDFTGAVNESITLYAGFKAVTYTVTYAPGKYGTGSIPAGAKEHGVDFILATDTFTRQGWAQTSWKSDEGDCYSLGGTYSTDADITLYPGWEQFVTLSAAFSTRVTLGDSGVPGETVFTLAIVDASGAPVSAEAVTVSGSVTTNGAGSFGSAMSLTGTVSQIRNMLGQGVFVRQVDAGAGGWVLDGTVWGVRLYEETSNARAAAYALQIFPATVSNGSYVIDAGAGPVAQMQFTNVYTAHDYQLKHDEDGHWEECACKDVRNEEPHRFGDWVVTKKPTGTASGLKERECAVCHYTEIVWLAPLSPTASPATGDTSNLTLWIALLGVSAAGLIAAVLYGKRRKNSRH